MQQGGIDSTYNSSNLQYTNTSSYSKDKTLATLGQGEITLSDDSDLTALNRDTSTTSRDLFEVDRQQGNVDVTLDHRLLTEEGRNNIAEDVKRNELGLSSLADVVTKDSVSLGDTFEHVDNVQKNLDVQKLVASQAEGKFAVILNNLDTATASEKQAAINAYAAAYAEVYGVNIESALVVAVTKMTHGAHYMNGNGASQIVINDETMKNAKDYMTTLGHEVTHGQVAQGGLDSRENKTLNEEYASLMGRYSADNYAFVLENSGLGTVREGDINRHHGNQSALISRNSSNYLADEALLPAGSIEYYLNQEEVQNKLSLLASCNQQGAGSAVCQQLNQTNQLDHMRDAELQAACQDMSSPGCRAQIAKAQAALNSFDEGVSPWDDTRFGQEQESIRVVLNDPSGRARQAQQEKLDLAFNVLADFSPGVGDAKGFAEAETKLDYLLATVGLVPVAGDLVKMAADALKAGKVDEAQKLLSKAQEHLQHVDADFDLPDLALPAPPHLDKAPSMDLDVSGTRLGSPEMDSSLTKQDVEGHAGDVGGNDVSLQRGTTGDWNKLANNPEPNTRYEFENGYSYKTDANGRVNEVEAELQLEPWDRNNYQQKVSGRDCRETSDCGGHLIASMFGGPGEGINLVPMNAKLNGSGGEWYRLETQWRNVLDNGGTVKVKIEPKYSSNSKRPESFKVNYSINGVVQIPMDLKNTPTGN